MGHHFFARVQAKKVLKKKGKAYEWTFQAVGKNHAANFGQPRLVASKMRRSRSGCQEKAKKVLNKESEPEKTPIFSNILCTSYN